MINYLIEGQLLIIKETNTGIVKWQGKPYGCSPKKIVPIINPVGCVVLLDYDDFYQSKNRSKSNLLFLNPNGEIIWHAELPSTSDDVYTFLSEESQKISANSMNGFFVHIDLTTGKITDRLFTK
jgi:hypothetical protein